MNFNNTAKEDGDIQEKSTSGAPAQHDGSQSAQEELSPLDVEDQAKTADVETDLPSEAACQGKQTPQDDGESESDNGAQSGQQETFAFHDQVICFLHDNDIEESDDEESAINQIDKSSDDRLSLRTTFENKDECDGDKLKVIQNLASDLVKRNDVEFIVNAIETIENISSHIDNITFHTSVASVALEETCGINALPREILLEIFTYFSQRELCQYVLPVCKTWYEVGYDPSLWQVLDFSRNPGLATLDLCRAIKRACHVKKLILTGRYENLMTEAEVAVFTSYARQLRKVNLGFCDGLSKAMIRYFVQNCDNLESLNIEGCHLVNDDAVRVIAQKDHWKDLNFSHCNLTDIGLQILATKTQGLVSLNIDGISWIHDRAIGTLVDHQGDSLQRLEIDGAELTDASIQHIVRCKQLQSLMVSFSDNLTDQSLRLLQQSRSLTALKLRRGANFSSAALISLFQSPAMCNITILNLSECIGIVDDVVIAIMKCCGAKLRELSLCWCWHVTDVGLISIVDHCRCLHSLELVGLHEITCECIHRIPEMVPHLKLLDVQQCNRVIDQILIDVLQKKRDLTVYNYYGEKFIHT